MKNIRLVLLMAGLAALLGAAPVFSQEDMKTVPRDGFAAPRRPAALFPHDAHNEKAGLADCGACHHGEKDGKADPAATSEGTPCAQCHPAAPAPGKTPLMRAYHRLCVDCHMNKGAGPVACGQCHAPS